MRITTDMKVEATDGPCGEVGDIVIDPVRRRVTHLVVQPHRQHERARLVPIEAVASCEGHAVLSWTTARLLEAPLVVETEFLVLPAAPQPVDGWDIGIRRVLAWPYYGSMIGAGVGGGYTGPITAATMYDKIPPGAAEVRRASSVLSSDDHVVGHVEGFIVDPDHGITCIVLERGHMWGRREVTIPITDVDTVKSDVVQLRLTRDAIGDLPSVPFDRHHTA